MSLLVARLLVLLLLLAAACGGGAGAAGTYVHPEEGTITLSEGGAAAWTQEGNPGPFEFEWSQEGDVITFIVEGAEAGAATLEEGNLVLGPEMISGGEPVTFERQ